jgi:4-amino-4-deoxy-L-arabinose transferase-like glycosyltransferase
VPSEPDDFGDMPAIPMRPIYAVAALILGTAILRMIVASTTGLGIDESYMTALARQIQLGYFDHPPLAWWITWGAEQLFRSEANWVVRLPFVVLFAATTWAMYGFAAALFGARAGLWAAVLLNLVPVLGVTTATWVLPDGPLVLMLLCAGICLVRALDGKSGNATLWWLLTGICAGLALLSKYSAVLIVAGVFFFLLTTPTKRFWLARPQPYMAGIVAVLIFAPVIIWNLDHGFASFAFQGGRATGAQWHPGRVFQVLGGEALFLLPWIWLLLILQLIGALTRGPSDERRWLCAWLGVIPVILFALVAAWSPHRVLYHWAAPGYMMLLPLAGHWIARHIDQLWLRRAIAMTATFVVILLAIFATQLHFNYMPAVLGDPWTNKHPDSDAVDWTDLRASLAQQNLLDDHHFVASTRWLQAGKYDYAVGGTIPVVVLDTDDREYGIEHPMSSVAGRDGIIVDPQMTLAEIQQRYGKMFASIEPLPVVTLNHAGQPMMTLNLFMGHGFQPPQAAASAQ